jgi:hypothetical protein
MIVDTSRRLPLCATAIFSGVRSRHSVELVTDAETDIWARYCYLLRAKSS